MAFWSGFQNFCSAKGSAAPSKILKIKCLRLAAIGFLTTYFEDSFISHSVTNCSCNWRSFPITLVVLNFHRQRHFDDCLKISVLGRSGGNYELTWISLEWCIKTLCLFSERFELWLQRILGRLTFPYFRLFGREVSKSGQVLNWSGSDANWDISINKTNNNGNLQSCN